MGGLGKDDVIVGGVRGTVDVRHEEYDDIVEYFKKPGEEHEPPDDVMACGIDSDIYYLGTPRKQDDVAVMLADVLCAGRSAPDVGGSDRDKNNDTIDKQNDSNDNHNKSTDVNNRGTADDS